MSKPRNKKPISRRQFMEGTGAALVAAAAVPSLQAQSPVAKTTRAADAASPDRVTVHLTVNGAPHNLEVDDRWTLAEVLRDHLGLTGTKLGCDRGECGACTVHIDGKPMYSCSQLAAWMDGHAITTVEGLIQNGKLDPLQQSFMDHDAPQCGFCTSGQLMSAKAVLAAHPHPTREQIRAGMTAISVAARITTAMSLPRSRPPRALLAIRRSRSSTMPPAKTYSPSKPWAAPPRASTPANA
jgi:xanthine dehydrogenase YagT iron-sulfur-binding subunit